MKWDEGKKALALAFARVLSQRDYTAAHEMLSAGQKRNLYADKLGEAFEGIIPLDWGIVDPIEIYGDDSLPFLYVVLGGEVYSEVIIINEIISEDGLNKISDFQFGRP